VASEARGARIADQIQRELAELIRTEVRDPRVGLVTLTGVELSRDQSHAKVFFTVLGADGEEALEGLGRAAGFLRSELARRLTTRKVPELHFAYDESVERGVRLSRLIDEAVKPTPVAKPARGKAAAKPTARKPRSTKG
jgi:ribosome-binding factor A